MRGAAEDHSLASIWPRQSKGSLDVHDSEAETQGGAGAQTSKERGRKIIFGLILRGELRSSKKLVHEIKASLRFHTSPSGCAVSPLVQAFLRRCWW